MAEKILRRLAVLFLVNILFSSLALGGELVLTPSDTEMKSAVEEPLTFSFSLPRVKKAHLYFLARAATEKIGGYADALTIALNGAGITEEKRLINKPFQFKMKGIPDKVFLWFTGGTWLVPVSPDYTSIDKHYRYAIEGVKAHEFVFDITDLVKEENNIRFIRRPRTYSKIHLFFKKIKIVYEPAGEGKAELIKKEEITIREAQSSSFFLAKEDKIPAEETKVWSLPTRKDGQKVLLKITCRRDSEKLGGYGYYLQLSVNSKPLDAYKNRKEERLLSKSPFFVSNKGEETFWNLGDGIWLTFFSPDFKTDVSRYGVFDKEPYAYLLDVTDLLEEEDSNYLTATNLFSRIKERQYKRKFPVIASLEVITLPEEKKEMLSEKSLDLKGKPAVSLLSEGGFESKFENVSLLFESTFSYPDGGFNQLGEKSSSTQEKEWQVKGEKISSNQWQVNAKGKYYSILRKINLFPDHIQIDDKINNLSSEEIGIIFSNHLRFADSSILYCQMGGRTGQSLNNLKSQGNPTLFFPFKNSGLGIVVNDDVYRNQGLLFYDLKGETSGIKNEMFALGQNASYTLSWSVYFVSSADYYDFINLVRRDWGSNITIEGPVYFDNYRSIAESSDEELKKLIREKNAKYIVFWEVRTKEIIPEYGKEVVAMGTGIFDPLFEEEMKILRKAIAKIRQVAPEVKLSLYTHSFFISPEQPDDPKFKDSWLTDKDGKRAISQYSSAICFRYQPVYPTLTNSYGKAYDKFIDFYLNDLGLDWIYWDESNGPGTLGENSLTYNTWDGHTAKINLETKKIEKKCAILTLVCDAYIISVADKVRKKGGFILFNGSAPTKARLSLPSFTETQDLILRSYRLHLNTPLAFGFGSPPVAELRRRLNYGCIYARTFLNYKSNIVTKFYPFTPEELHSGWVKGKERIITNKSGSFGWDGVFNAKLFLFDKQGELVDSNPQVKSYKDKAEIKVPEEGIAILERAE